jgi:site-specific DNA-methyltransferase (cytosine-N4-specific)
MTSPPFGLVRKKAYGNADADAYLEWFRPFAAACKRALKDSGSLVIDIGGAWVPGQPTRSLYHFKLLIMLCEEFGFHLAQEFYWWNPAKLPTPAEWVTVRRIRVKDAVNTVWWLSPTPWPRASNRRVLQPYSDAMKALLKNGYNARLRPSGHDISEHFSTDNGAAIPPNLLALAHTESNSAYLRHCRERGLPVHPARFPAGLPEYFVRMLTDPGDLVVDPFAGSCVTGEVCERLARRWVCIEEQEDYLLGALGRFAPPGDAPKRVSGGEDAYRVPRVGLHWTAAVPPPLAPDGGRVRPPAQQPGRGQPAGTPLAAPDRSWRAIGAAAGGRVGSAANREVPAHCPTQAGARNAGRHQTEDQSPRSPGMCATATILPQTGPAGQLVAAALDSAARSP